MKSTSITWHTTDETVTQLYAATLAQHCPASCLLFLQGELGSGKTTFVRGFLRSLGYNQSVTSPTYALVEQYQTMHRTIFHFDLYRLTNPHELEDIGMRDYLNTPAIILIEWPEKAAGFLPTSDLTLQFTSLDLQQRSIYLTSHTPKGEQILKTFFNSR